MHADAGFVLPCLQCLAELLMLRANIAGSFALFAQHLQHGQQCCIASRHVYALVSTPDCCSNWMQLHMHVAEAQKADWPIHKRLHIFKQALGET